MDPLHKLAEACGVTREWRDVEGRTQAVEDGALEAILSALGHETGSARQIERGLAKLERERHDWPAMLVADAGQAIALPAPAVSAEATSEDGASRKLSVEGGWLEAIAEPGYYDLIVDGRVLQLAVAPPHCPLPASKGVRPWGVSLQIPSLRGVDERAFGNFVELDEAVGALARCGADAIAINPVHALFPGNGIGFSPYSPSSRLFFNSAMGDPALVGLPTLPSSKSQQLIDWPNAMPRRLAELRAVFAGLDTSARTRIAQECNDEALHRHALFDALDCHFRPRGAHGWRDWPATFRDPASSDVAGFAAENAGEVEFHTFLQWLARNSLEAVHNTTQHTGMVIGLIADIAVGVDPSGSDAWSMREAMLNGLTIGAPPDPLGPLGQNWSITGFSPEALKVSGYAPWLAMLRSALGSCGGLRIDHAFGLARLWVIPEGGGPGDGAYLAYPFHDLLRLATLEAHRAQSLVIAEDLGTAPHGFTQAVTERRMLGMRVLWFERAADHGFIGAQDYAPLSVAMTGTHDTVTVAGWWSGRDLDWADRLGRLPDGLDRTKAEEIREWDRGLLWSTIGDDCPHPAPEDTARVVDAAVRHIARTPTQLAIIPLEDLAGEVEQPNLPGTIDEHPNWRRRMKGQVKDMIEDPSVKSRTDALGIHRTID